MRKNIPKISESPSQLKELIKKQRDFNRRNRLKALYLLKTEQAKNRREAANKLEVAKETVGRWIDDYEQGGVKQMLYIKKSGRKPGQRTIPEDVCDSLKNKLRNTKGFGTYGEIQEWLKRKHKVKIKYPTLHRIVYYEFKAKPKVPRPVNIKKLQTS